MNNFEDRQDLQANQSSSLARKDMIDAYKASIARIFSHSGNIAIGAAFLVSDKHLFTCASVVAQALSIPQNISETPPREIYLEFPISAPGEILTARVLLW